MREDLFVSNLFGNQYYISLYRCMLVCVCVVYIFSIELPKGTVYISISFYIYDNYLDFNFILVNQLLIVSLDG